MVSLLLSTVLLGSLTAVAQEPAPAPPEPAPATPSTNSVDVAEITEVSIPDVTTQPADAPPAETVVVAAEAAPTDTPAGDASQEAPQPAAEGESDAEGNATKGEDNSLQTQIDEYWSSEGRDLNSLTNRLFTKSERFEGSLYIGMDPASQFWTYLTVGLRFSYFFNEYYGMEFSGSYLHGFSNELQTYLRETLGEGFNADYQINDKGVFRTDVLFVWRPLYGKFGLFNKKLAHFDFNLVAGAGIYGVMRPDINAKKANFAVEVEGTLGAGFAVFITKDITVRFDTRAFMYRGAETVTDKTFAQRLQFPTEISLGVSYLF